MTFIRNIWYVAAWSSELGPDRPIARTIAGENLALWRRADGSVVAMEDRCPHRLAPLSLGRIEGDTLRCMYHGLSFGADGLCRHVPGSDVIPPHSTTLVYPTVEQSSWIWVWLGDPELADPAAIPKGWQIDDPAWVINHSAMDYAADYQLINDNLTDLSHLDYVHETTLGAATGTAWSKNQPRVTMLPDGVLIERWNEDIPVYRGSTDRCDRLNSYRYLLPGIFLMTTRLYPIGTAAACDHGQPSIPPFSERIDQQAATPVSEGRSRYLYATGVAASEATPALLADMMTVVNAAFEEDRTIIEAQQRVWNVTPAERRKAFIPQDKAPALLRRMIARRIAGEARSTAGTAA